MVARYLSYLSLILIFTGFSSQDSSDRKEKPKVNFCGTFTSRTGKTIEIENITINRRYKEIEAYKKPAKTSENPQHQKVKLDLSETLEIRLPGAEPVTTTYEGTDVDGKKFKDTYVEIEIVSNDKDHTKNSYLVEARRKIFFDQINPAGPLETETSLSALGTITIKGYAQSDKDAKKESSGDCSKKSASAIK